MFARSSLRLFLFLFLSTVLSPPAPSQETRAFTIPRAQFGPLETAAQLMARGGWPSEAEDLVAVMKALGYGEQPSEKLAKICKAEAKGKKRAPVPAIVKQLKAAAQQIAKAIPAIDAPGARAAAEATLLIDGSIESLHKALGEEKTPAGWRSPEDAQALARRAEIQSALIKARRLMPEITVTEDNDPIIKEIHGTPCNKVSSHGVTLWSRWSPEKLRRVLVEALRALAVSNYLTMGVLEIPEFKQDCVLLESQNDYKRSIEIARGLGWLTDKAAEEATHLGGFYSDRTDIQRCEVSCELVESAAEASIVFGCLFWRLADMCPPLRAGHLNWICLSYLGAPMPGVAFTEVVGEKRQRKTASGADPADERREVLRLAEAGLAGSRSWLAYLAAHGEDPPFSNSIVDQVGKIEGDDRLKCTFVVEFLHEHNELLALADKTKLGQRAEFEKAWGTPFAAFEARWRRWLLPARPSIVERLDPPKTRVLTASETDVLARLNDHRRHCLKGSICGDVEPPGSGDWPADLVDSYADVTLDDGLTEGARKHALYLGRNPEQAAKWPDAHEEWPDKAGFSPEGGWAGTHSVIFPGVRSGEEALTGWLGTFYHRLPLIHPGLMRIGWALENQMAVLDSGSLSRPRMGPWHVIWPYDGMQNVPTHFAPENPNPVPGVDEATFGYPVTLQIGGFRGDGATPTIVIELHETSEKGAEIACHVSTPEKPSNADLPLSDAWCLIPKAPLKPATTYFATAKWSNGRKIAWTFKTAK